MSKDESRRDNTSESEADRVTNVLAVIAKMVTDNGVAKGVVHDVTGYFERCLASQRLQNTPMAVSLIRQHPDWTDDRIARAIHPPETRVPPPYVPEGTGTGVGFGDSQRSPQ